MASIVTAEALGIFVSIVGLVVCWRHSIEVRRCSAGVPLWLFVYPAAYRFFLRRFIFWSPQVDLA